LLFLLLMMLLVYWAVLIGIPLIPPIAFLGLVRGIVPPFAPAEAYWFVALALAAPLSRLI
jgi:hypothetical protein